MITTSPPTSTLRALARRWYRALPPRLQCLLISSRAGASARRGHGSYVHPSVQILGQRSVAIGSNSVLSQDCWLNVNHRSSGQPAIVIGDHCFIGRRNFFSSGCVIRLKDFVLTANDCHFLGSTHIADDPMVPIMLTGTTASDTIIIGANCFVGAGARFVGNVSVGHGCIIAAGSTVTRDMPPFSTVMGSPATVRRRYSLLRQAWVDTADFTAEEEMAIPAENQYIAELCRHGPIAMPYLAAGNDMGNC